VAPPLQASWIRDLVNYEHPRNFLALDDDVSGNFDYSVGCDLGQAADVRSYVSYDEFPLEALTFLQSNPESFSSKNC
jgi:hypothetical protein